VRPRFSVALLTEDRSEQTWRGLKSILEKLLRRYEDDGRTVRVEVVPAQAGVRAILIANRWRSAKPRDEPEKRELWRYLAWTISQADGFVVFHYDGDTTWSRRGESQAVEKFAEVRTRVRQVLSGMRPPPSPEEIVRRMARLIECVPFYSVEAWTFQSTTQAIALCRKKHHGAHVKTYQDWGADRTLLDEELRPKEIGCLGGDHNEELGKHVPVWEVARSGGSLTYFVWSLHVCDELGDALASPP
jgi:hypothetical protein